MHIKKIQLKKIRTFEDIELNLTNGIHLITGNNASGKTNLLESMHYLATTKSIQNRNDKNFISWKIMQESALPIGKISAHINTLDEIHEIDMMFSKPIKETIANDNEPSGKITKNFRLNGITKKASEIIGTLRAIYASPNDMQIILGTPAERRKYLDILISQYSKKYLKNLQKYNRIIRQRNSLLKQIKHIKKRYDELDYWDSELAIAASEIINLRSENINQLSARAKFHYEILDNKNKDLKISYRPALPQTFDTTKMIQIDKDYFIDILQKNRPVDLRQSSTVFGPHRDDINIDLSELAANAYGSRGQQKLITICMRLAEAHLSNQVTNDQPILLLDDILSEFDEEHRNYIVEHAANVEQVFLTSPDLSNVPKKLIDRSIQFNINDGNIKQN
ncbi:MAG: DNA replication/repair protein RecF [Dehalococcoidia bacterium]|nr:DNA replication/repair protein RecF [Dehalococcoidia bacterium]